MGDFTLLVSDQENAIEDFAKLLVTINQIKLFGSGAPLTIDISEADQKEADLVLLQGDNAEEIISSEVPVGIYSHVFLRVKTVQGVLVATGTPPDIKAPSNSFKIQIPFEVKVNEPLTFVYDIEVGKTGKGSYNIKPVIGKSGADKGFKLNKGLDVRLLEDPCPGPPPQYMSCGHWTREESPSTPT